MSDSEPFPSDPIAQEQHRDDALLLDIDGFEGPLDLLLTLARAQKLDLRKISILQLAERYLEFVEAAKKLRIELAADYLVMAAWLAFLKSRLLLPPDPQEEGPSGEELAAHLAFQLERLEAMRKVAARLMARDQLGRDIFARGEPQERRTSKRVSYSANLLDLIQAYARIRTKDDFTPLHYDRAEILTMEQALDKMRHIIPQGTEWQDLSAYLPSDWITDPQRRRSAMAASFAASLELAKQGFIELRQEALYAPVYIRKKPEE